MDTSTSTQALAKAPAPKPPRPWQSVSPGARTPTLLQTTSSTESSEGRRAARQALVSWLARIDLPDEHAERTADALLAHFDLVPCGLGAVLRGAAREMQSNRSGQSKDIATSLGPDVLLAIHEAYAPELSRPSATEQTEEYLAARR